MSKGKIIVLEGLDGCGKSTQLELAFKVLSDMGIPCRLVSFPNYSSPSGEIITRYLGGSIPCEGETGAFAASSFYAADRYISYVTDWKKDYESGFVILCGRYSTSNAIYQMTKMPEERREEYLSWLCDFEYDKLGLPQPDLVIFLDMPLEVSQQLLTERYGGDERKKDIHESDLDYMRQCRESAMHAARHFGWSMVSCSDDGLTALPVGEIHERTVKIIKDMIQDA